jgi:hypothetical protein
VEYLYVCHFSNGHIKVGRARYPVTRIGQHADRVACFGVILINSYSIECLGPVIGAESDLLNECKAHSTAQHLDEWFEGLDFKQVCGWAYLCATRDEPLAVQVRADDGSIDFKAIVRSLMARGVTQATIAAYCGCHQCTVSDIATGKTTDPFYSMGVKLLALHESKA